MHRRGRVGLRPRPAAVIPVEYSLLAPLGLVTFTVAVGLQFGAVGLAVWAIFLLALDWL